MEEEGSVSDSGPAAPSLLRAQENKKENVGLRREQHRGGGGVSRGKGGVGAPSLLSALE